MKMFYEDWTFPIPLKIVCERHPMTYKSSGGGQCLLVQDTTETKSSSVAQDPVQPDPGQDVNMYFCIKSMHISTKPSQSNISEYVEKEKKFLAMQLLYKAGYSKR